MISQSFLDNFILLNIERTVIQMSKISLTLKKI